MDIDPKHLKAMITAEIIRRESQLDRENEAACANQEHPSCKRLQDVVRAFEPVDLEGLLPLSTRLEHPPIARTSADAGARRLYNRLRRTVLGRYLDHPRVLGLLHRARQRPGGVTVRNLAWLTCRAVIIRIPLLGRLVKYLAVSRHLPARVAVLETQLAEANTILRNLCGALQDQVNQSLYTHAVATQHNDDYLLRRIRRNEQRIRECLTPSAAAGTSGALPSAAAAQVIPNESGFPPELYGAFEERFRGSRELVRERLRANLGRFIPLPEAKNKPVLDLGCGRGEWLQLLAERGIVAEGVDSSPWMVSHCQEAGLTARQGDAIDYLASLPDNALAGLTGFHIIEHLPTAVLIRLFEQARRVVQPGGVVLFETPNPENLTVGACNFYIDPTHRNPLPPALIAFLLEEYGFENVEIERRHPADAAALAAGTLAEPLASLLFGPLDYAAIAYVPYEEPECT